MALTKDQKTAQVTELATKLKDSQSVMFSHFIGLNVGDVSDLRSQLRENGAEMKVAKKTLIKLAFKEAGLPDITPKEIDGPIGCIMSYEDPLSGAQTAFKFSKDHDKVTLVGGVYDGKLLTPQESMTLAQMPGREELLGMFVGMLRSPLVSFASLCTSPLGGFARALDQMADKGGFVKDEVQTPEVAPEPAEEAEPAAAPEEEAA
ncbi:MAG: 50S ribosomal protein L10, partial [Candidatus Peribacter sp.]|nr:50S ribosomal protein L10 [Candidatus Peribacter sp.]